MGVKAIKEKYKIEHIVHKRGGVIWIGSPMAPEIIGIDMDGNFVKTYKNRKYNDGWNTNEDLKRYQEEMISDKESGELKRLIQLRDIFTDLKPIYTCSGGKVIKTYCETYGWPNTDIRGCIMYDNTYHRTYNEAYHFLLRETSLMYPWRAWKGNISDAFTRIFKSTGYLLTDISKFIYARTIQRISVLFTS